MVAKDQRSVGIDGAESGVENVWLVSGAEYAGAATGAAAGAAGVSLRTGSGSLATEAVLPACSAKFSGEIGFSNPTFV